MLFRDILINKTSNRLLIESRFSIITDTGHVICILIVLVWKYKTFKSNIEYMYVYDSPSNRQINYKFHQFQFDEIR